MQHPEVVTFYVQKLEIVTVLAVELNFDNNFLVVVGGLSFMDLTCCSNILPGKTGVDGLRMLFLNIR